MQLSKDVNMQLKVFVCSIKTLFYHILDYYVSDLVVHEG